MSSTTQLNIPPDHNWPNNALSIKHSYYRIYFRKSLSKMSDEDMSEEYDLEYSEAESDEPDIDLENQYYSAKSLKGDDDDGALAGFKRVLELESQGEERGQWGFKALKQMTKINFYLGRFDAMLDAYRKNCQNYLIAIAINR